MMRLVELYRQPWYGRWIWHYTYIDWERNRHEFYLLEDSLPR